MVPPTPGYMFCAASIEVTSESIPAESSKPLTTRASDSFSESNTLTSFSLGLGRFCASAAAGLSAIMSSNLPDALPATNCNSTTELLDCFAETSQECTRGPEVGLLFGRNARQWHQCGVVQRLLQVPHPKVSWAPPVHGNGSSMGALWRIGNGRVKQGN